MTVVDGARVSQAATYAGTDGRGGVIDVATDPLDGSVWVRMTSWPRAQEAAASLHAYGLAVVDRGDCRLTARRRSRGRLRG